MQASQPGFFKSFALPLLIIFLIPSLSWWFFSLASEKEDERVLAMAYQMIENYPRMTDSEKASEAIFFRENPPSLTCLKTGEVSETLTTLYSNVCPDFKRINHFKNIGRYTIFVSLGTIGLILILLLVFFSSRKLRYLAFKISWNLSRIMCVGHIIAQIILSLGVMSYGMLIFSFPISPIFITIIGSLFCLAGLSMIKSFFKHPDESLYVYGHSLSPQKAPALWKKINEICRLLQTKPPQNIVLGVDDNFLVTDDPIITEEENLSGRSLHLSIFHLVNLPRDEVNAIIAHELALFCDQDDFYSRKVKLIFDNIDFTLGHFSELFFNRPIYYLLLFFKSIFRIRFKKIDLSHQLRADKLTIEAIGAISFAHSAIKQAFYSTYRTKPKSELYEINHETEAMNFLERTAYGFQKFALGERIDQAFWRQQTPNPYNQKFTLDERLKTVKFDLDELKIRELFQKKNEDNWFKEISIEEDILENLIDEFEGIFENPFDKSLALKYRPKNESEKKIVECYYPPRTFALKEGHTLKLNFEKIIFSEWKKPVFYRDIEDINVDDQLRPQILKIILKNKNLPKADQELHIPIENVEFKVEKLFKILLRYYFRDFVANGGDIESWGANH